jgi:hypothetical protein
MACCDTCQHFDRRSGTTWGWCRYHAALTETFNHQCGDGYHRTPKEVARRK